MTLPTTTTLNSCDDDSDMFGPPRSSPPIGYHHHRSRVPMISPKLRQREERKRILQLCAHKLERIKDSETNLRRSVCINNTYCRLTDELRREKQSRYLANLPNKPESARENIFNPYNSCSIDSSNHQPSNKSQMHNVDVTSGGNNNNNNSNDNAGRCLLDSDDEDIDIINNNNNNNKHNNNMMTDIDVTSIDATTTITAAAALSSRLDSSNSHDSYASISSHKTTSNAVSNATTSSLNAITTTSSATAHCTSHSSASSAPTTPSRKRHSCSSKDVDTDLEILDRELNAINTPMPLIDPEITQGAEQLEKAISRKRARSEDDNDRLVREALQFYMPPPRVISAIEDGPLDLGGLMMGGIGPCGVGMGMGGMGVVGMGGMSMGLGMMGMAGMSMGVSSCSMTHQSGKRPKLSGSSSTVASAGMVGSGAGSDLVELDFELSNQSQKEFEVIMDALRLGTPSPTPSVGSDSCGQAAMMMSESANVFHNLVVTSLET